MSLQFGSSPDEITGPVWPSFERIQKAHVGPPGARSRRSIAPAYLSSASAVQGSRWVARPWRRPRPRGHTEAPKNLVDGRMVSNNSRDPPVVKNRDAIEGEARARTVPNQPLSPL